MLQKQPGEGASVFFFKKNLEVHIDNSLKWKFNTDAVYISLILQKQKQWHQETQQANQEG